MCQNHNEVEKAYLRSEIDIEKKALTPGNKTNHAHQYTMLQYSLGKVYVLVGGSENKKAEAA